MAQWTANLLYLMTLLAVIWYTYETRKMRLQTIRPKLIFLVRRGPQGTLGEATSIEAFIRNVGNGAALNILVERVIDQGFEFRADPEQIPIVDKGEEVKLALRPAAASNGHDMTTVLSDTSVSLKMRVKYLDVEGRAFRTSTTVGAGATAPFITDERH